MNSPIPDVFQPDPAEYDALIDWERRLRREAPFFKHCFARVDARRVLDTACGTGRHAAAFRDWGFEVVGADLSPAMLDFCRARWGQSDRLSWSEHAFELAHDPPFDAVVCVGNSLAIAPDAASVRKALSAMLASLRPGGALAIQVLNAWRISEGPVVWDKCKRIADHAGDRWLMKGFHRVGDDLYVEILSLRCDQLDERPSTRSVKLRALDAEQLLNWMQQAGGLEIELFGDYEMNAYDRAASQDIILVARNGAAA